MSTTLVDRRVATVAVALVIGAMALVGCGKQDVSLRAIPTTPASGSTSVCGALPRAAVELAVGTSELRVVQPNKGLDQLHGSDTAGCFVYPKTGSKKLLMDVVFSSSSQSDNQIALEQLSASSSRTTKALPADLGTGLTSGPAAKDDGRAFATLMNGQYRLSIEIVRGPGERDQRKDVLAIARLLKPYFPF